MECVYAVASNCSSATYGNIAQHVREYIKLLSPKDFYNYEYISSEIAYRTIRRQLGPNTRKHLEKRVKPYLIIRPIFNVPDDLYLYGTPLTTQMDNLEVSVDKRFTFPIIQDRSEGIGLSYRLNWDKIDFNVTIITSTLFQQIDLRGALKNFVRWDRPFTRRLPLEFMIPRGMVMAMAARKNYDMNSVNYAAGVFLDYLNGNSAYPITYKMRTSTSKDEYFMYSNQEVLFTFSDLQWSEGTRKGMADDEFTITFNVSAEFKVPGMFFLYGSDKLKEKTMGEIVQAEMIANGLSFPLFTYANLFGPADDKRGFRKFTSSILQVELNKDGNDVTDFGVLLNNEIRSVVRSYQLANNTVDTIASLSLFCNSKELVEGVDFSVNWSNFTVTTYHPSLEDCYRFILYLNQIKVDETIVALTDNAASDKPKPKPKE